MCILFDRVVYIGIISTMRVNQRAIIIDILTTKCIPMSMSDDQKTDFLSSIYWRTTLNLLSFFFCHNYRLSPTRLLTPEGEFLRTPIMLMGVVAYLPPEPPNQRIKFIFKIISNVFQLWTRIRIILTIDVIVIKKKNQKK